MHPKQCVNFHSMDIWHKAELLKTVTTIVVIQGNQYDYCVRNILSRRKYKVKILIKQAYNHTPNSTLSLILSHQLFTPNCQSFGYICFSHRVGK